MSPLTTDVLIVGGGPVGLLTGIGLVQQDVDCLVIGMSSPVIVVCP